MYFGIVAKKLLNFGEYISKNDNYLNFFSKLFDLHFGKQ